MHAERLGNWAVRNGRVSESQKGFMPVDGCAEHNFVLQSIITDARRNGKQCCVAWLDLTNAFGSVPHNTIFEALKWAGLHEDAIQVVRHLYVDTTTNVRTSTGPTSAIPIKAGVKQGYPLSPIIFNLAIEPILRAIGALNVGYRMQESKIDTLAYADDVALITPKPEDLQRLLDVTTTVARWAELTFNARKCATLHIMTGNIEKPFQHVLRTSGCPDRLP